MSENNKQEHLKKEEKKPQYGLTMAIIAGALVLFMCLFIPTGPMKKYNRAKAEVMDLRSQLELALQNKAAEEARLRGQETLMERLTQRAPNFDLYMFLNSTLSEAQLKERATLDSYKPRSDKKNAAENVNMVQMSVSGVTLSQFVDLFHKIYSSNNLITIHRMEFLRPASDGKGLECKVIFLSPKPLG